jgi:hypothetical protein
MSILSDSLIITTNGVKSASELTNQDSLLGMNGPLQISDITTHAEDVAIKLTMANNYTVICSQNSLIFTDSGLKPVSHLSIGEELITIIRPEFDKIFNRNSPTIYNQAQIYNYDRSLIASIDTTIPDTTMIDLSFNEQIPFPQTDNLYICNGLILGE